MGAADRYHADEQRARAEAVARLPPAHRLAHHVGSAFVVSAILVTALVVTGSLGILVDTWRWLVGA